jgi:hypothetical protein
MTSAYIGQEHSGKIISNFLLLLNFLGLVTEIMVAMQAAKRYLVFIHQLETSCRLLHKAKTDPLYTGNYDRILLR